MVFLCNAILLLFLWISIPWPGYGSSDRSLEKFIFWHKIALFRDMIALFREKIALLREEFAFFPEKYRVDSRKISRYFAKRSHYSLTAT